MPRTMDAIVQQQLGALQLQIAALQVQIYGNTTVKVEKPAEEDYYHVWHPGVDYFQRYEQAG